MKKSKARYVDGFVLVVPKKKVGAYKKMAEEAKKMWMRLGALSYRECMIDDIKPPLVTFTFPKMIKAKKGETVWFSYVEYKSKQARDMVNKKIMKEMEKKYGKQDKKQMEQMPFDMKRIANGGFTVEVSS